MIHLDDILIYSDNMFIYYWHVKEVLKQLYKASFYIKVEKYKFHSKLVEYLGYILSSSRLTMLNDKIRTIYDWPKLKKVKNIQSLLGIINFIADLFLTIPILTFC